MIGERIGPEYNGAVPAADDDVFVLESEHRRNVTTTL
jgi:hypothetical protein